LWFFWCILGPWATANYCRAGIKSLRGTLFIFRKYVIETQEPPLEYFWIYAAGVNGYAGIWRHVINNNRFGKGAQINTEMKRGFLNYKKGDLPVHVGAINTAQKQSLFSKSTYLNTILDRCTTRNSVALIWKICLFASQLHHMKNAERKKLWKRAVFVCKRCKYIRNLKSMSLGACQSWNL
jgi:hypothetical protein